jgi:type VI secretion system protein ImpH
MIVSFLGLTGPSGALPYHYSRLLVERIRGGDLAFGDFLDIFHHRLISLFFKAWEKYRFLFSSERSLREARQDTFTSCLFSLLGFGTPGLQDRMEIESRALLSYAGLFAETHRTASSLQRILSDFLEVPVEVVPFVGEWLALGAADRSRLGSPSAGDPMNNRLGVDTILGGRVWDVQGEFRVRLGPLPYERYLGFLPQGDALAPARDLVRTYVGPELDFQMLLVLSAEDVRPSRLGDSGERKPLLGWTTWLCSGPCPRDAEGALFGFQ